MLLNDILHRREIGDDESAIEHDRNYLERKQQGAMARLTWQLFITSYLEPGQEMETRSVLGRLLRFPQGFSVRCAIEAIQRSPCKDFT